MKLLISFILLSCLSQLAYSQDLMAERIRQISGKKRSVYFDSGIFHNGGPKLSSKVKAMRHSYSESLGYERIVIDFTTNEIPRVYGYISNQHKKIFLDLFNTEVPASVGSFGSSKFVQKVDFFPIEADSVSLEMKFKSNVNVDIFYLEKPGRLVIDIKS
ncbi:hypothetical protein M899_0152 [Bacteriovorax sp. BSW11_IV]|uniref:hypothetical protein n=1 Tax=Bacteriovorax sp. BSW11_IV TaxID=1353529 RepID=UPI000389F330|nr:hypothetical protein [Bacteriovorax sp. BSW11_IV]EQC47003.1 hypothetical protein M899_0152 [Bacteriovorax sp. BSW11_IV]